MNKVARFFRSPYVALPVGCVALIWFSGLFRLDAMFRFVEPEGLRLLVPFMAFAAGASLLYFGSGSLSAAARRRRRWQLLALLVTLWFLLWWCHGRFVAQGEWWAHVVGWSPRAECLCLQDDRYASKEACIEHLMKVYTVDDGKIRQGIHDCWGERQVNAVVFSMALLYVTLAAGFGGLSALAAIPGSPIRVFVSYRRKDSAGLVTGPLANKLRSELGERNVFIDEEAIRAGDKWKRKIEAHCDVCHALVVVIGPAWLEELRKREESEGTDWVKFEIETAIGRDVRLVPFLLGGASMPEAENLPEGLTPLHEVQAVVLDRDAVTLEGEFRVLDRRKLRKAMEKLMVAIEKIRAVAVD